MLNVLTHVAPSAGDTLANDHCLFQLFRQVIAVSWHTSLWSAICHKQESEGDVEKEKSGKWRTGRGRVGANLLQEVIRLLTSEHSSGLSEGGIWWDANVNIGISKKVHLLLFPCLWAFCWKYGQMVHSKLTWVDLPSWVHRLTKKSGLYSFLLTDQLQQSRACLHFW